MNGIIAHILHRIIFLKYILGREILQFHVHLCVELAKRELMITEFQKKDYLAMFLLKWQQRIRNDEKSVRICASISLMPHQVIEFRDNKK